MRLYLAGIENVSQKNSYYVKIPSDCYCLISFYYCSDAIMQELIERVGRENILLDSGAFTFRMHGLKGEDIECYTQRYIDFINKWDLKYFFEMDIDMTKEDLPLVLELRKRIEVNTGKKCIPVWHKTRGIGHWKEIVENYSYIAIGGVTSKLEENYDSIIKKMVQYANNKGVKVHGLGYTRSDFIEKGFYSVDSTSWMGYLYGSIWIEQDGVPKVYKKTKKDSRLKTEDYPLIQKNNFFVWYKYQRQVKGKGFWYEIK